MASAVDDASGTPGPVITSHTDGEPVNDAITAHASSSAPYVLLAWAPEAEFEFPVQVVDGEAAKVLSTSGYNGPTALVARECSSEHVCDGPEISVQVDVANPAPNFTTSTWVEEWHRNDVAYLLTDEGDWAWYAGLIDGQHLTPSLNEPLLMLAAQFDDGVHTVQAVRCTEPPDQMPILDPPVCDLANGSEVRSFAVRTALRPAVTAVWARRFSPNGDGIRETPTIGMTADTAQLVSWELLRGSEVAAQGTVGEQAPGPYTFTLEGLNAHTESVPDGEYRLRVTAISLSATGQNIDDRVIRGETSTTVVIDTVAPRLSEASASPREFHPPVDGYRDHVRISGSLTAPAARLGVQLLRDGRVVRTLRLGARPVGPFTAGWRARDSANRLAKPGYYRYRFAVRDRVGNMAVRPGGWIRVRWRR